MGRIAIVIGALAGLTAVGMSAYAAHGGLAASAAATIQAATQTQLAHALALVLTGIWTERGGRFARFAAIAFFIGIVAFCGALYASALEGVRPAAAPFGGVSLMIGWGLLAMSAFGRAAPPTARRRK